MQYFYKKGNSFIILKHRLEENGSLPEGVVPSSQEEYDARTREMEEQEAALRATPAYARTRELNELHRKLNKTDYQAIKYAEGVLSKEEYAPMKAQREAWRARIRELEKEEEDERAAAAVAG